MSAGESERRLNRDESRPADGGGGSQPPPARIGMRGDPTRTPVEMQLQELWKHLLRIDTVPADGDFFKLGGDSIAALELAAEVEKIFGRSVTLPELLEASSLHAMARLIQERARDRPIPCIVPFKTDGRKDPLFVVHGLGGGVVQMRQLARELDVDRPVYAFQARGIDGVTRPFRRIEPMATTYLDALREVRPQGPFLLAGYSMGGVVAYEMAQRLVAAGERIRALILVDAGAPLPLPWRDRLSSSFLYGRLALRRIRRQIGAGRRTGYTRSLTRLMAANLGAVHRYRPAVFHGRIHMITSREGGANAGLDDRDRELARRLEGYLVKQRAQWIRLAQGGMEVHEVDGHHLELFRHPALDGLIARLRAILDDPGHDSSTS
jgi:thioesterase domain-containing protein/acyl carrier protein